MNIQTINGITGDYTAGERFTHAAALVPFASARGGFQIALTQNALGLGTILYYFKTNKPNKYQELKDIWYKFGGNPDSFNAFVDSGNQKDIRQVAPAVLNRFSAIKNLVNMAYKIKSGGTIGYITPQLGGMKPGGIGSVTAATASVVQSVVTGMGIIASMVLAFKKDPATDPDKFPQIPEDVLPGAAGDDDTTEKKSAFSNPLILVGLALVGAYLLFGTKGKSNAIN
jgi:hypothetical protein